MVISLTELVEGMQQHIISYKVLIDKQIDKLKDHDIEVIEEGVTEKN